MKPDDAAMSDAVSGSRATPWWSAIWSGLLSLMIPGLGQVRAQSWCLGLTLLGVNAAIGVALRCLTNLQPRPPLVAISIVAGAGYILLALAAATDAVRRTRRAASLARPAWFRSTCFTFVAAMLLGGAIEFLLPIKWRSFSIPAGSMAPTLEIGDYILAGPLPAGSMRMRGATILFKYPRDNTTDYVKRLVGLPGDRIQLRNGQLIINGQPCPRQPLGNFVVNDNGMRFTLKRYRETLPNGITYNILQATNEGAMNNTLEYSVPPDHVFVLGDNRDNSSDSRFLNGVGLVPFMNVFAEPGTIVWSRDTARIGTAIK